MKRAKKGDYDMAGITAQRVYEQNPEAQYQKKESLTRLAKVIKENPEECKYAHYLRMFLTEGYSLVEIANQEKVSWTLVQLRITEITAFLREAVKRRG